LFLAPQPQARAFAPTDPGVSELVLLSERDRGSEASAAELASAPEAAADLRNETCVSIGPFPTQADMRAALNSLTPLVPRIQYRDAHTTETRGFWVFLPAQPSREKALALARALSSKGVRDYYVVTAGDQQNTISLGLFHEQANAQKRLNEISALGFAPQLIARTEDLPVYWVDFAQNSAHPVDWRNHVNSQLDLRQQSVTCF
jgi:cell division septation protein DedD